MRIGRLRRRVVLMALGEAEDDFGQKIETWSAVAVLWGYVRPLNGREALVAHQMRPEVDHVITVRYPGSLATITPEHRLRYDAATGTRYFGIEAVLNLDERNRQLDLHCKEIPGDSGT